MLSLLLWCLPLANKSDENAFEKIIQLQLEEKMRQFKNPKHYKLNTNEGR